MKWIDKKLKNQPVSLKRHLKTPHHNYNNYKEKDELRAALLKEQVSAQTNGKFEPMCQVTIYYLEKKLKNAV